MGNPINKDIYVDYNGRRIYFCCNLCPPVFNKDPEKYIKIVDAELKAQKTATPETK
jgi:YHS domain-containing protein